MAVWRNSIRDRLKICCSKEHVGAIPSTATNIKLAHGGTVDTLDSKPNAEKRESAILSEPTNFNASKA